MKLIKLLFIFLHNIIISTIIYSQNLRFHHLTLENGLSNTHVYCIAQDKNGYIWIGTQDGLNKFDGYNFKYYYNIPYDTTTINDNTVFSILPENDTLMWVGTFRGLNKFNPSTNKFKSISFGIYGTSYMISPIKDIKKDKNGNLWLATTGEGIVKYNPIKNTYKEFPINKESLKPELTRYSCLLIDENNKIWAGTDGAGIIILDTLSGNIKQLIDKNDLNSLQGNENILFIYKDKNKIWIGTRERGLFLYNTETSKFKRYYFNHNDDFSIGGNEVYCCLKDTKGNLWFGVNDGGLNLFKPETEKFIRIWHKPGNKYGLLNNKIRLLFEDNQKNFWILSYQKDFNIYHDYHNFFKYYDPSADNFNETKVVISIAMDHQKNLWVGTDGGGLKYIDRQKNKILTYHPDLNNLPDKVIMTIFINDDKKLWLGTYTNGLVYFDPQNNKYKIFKNNPADKWSLSNNYVTHIIKDHNNNLWIATNGGGLNLMKKNEIGKFIHFTQENNPYGNTYIINNWINCLMEDKKGRIFIGTYMGFSILNPETFIIKNYQRKNTNKNELSHNTVYSIFQDSKNRIWLGTQNGFNLFDEKNNSFISFTIDDGLPNNVINKILEDEYGNLWISTNKGLSCFIPDKKIFKNYFSTDGLQSDEFFRNCGFKGFNNELFFGGINGITSFSPDEKILNYDIPEVIITDFKIFNKNINPLKVNFKNISYVDTINLTHKDKSFSIEFSAIHYTAPEKILYKYKLEGFDKNWNTIGSKYRYVTYTNLKPGIYKFHIKASSIDGIWSNKYKTLTIVIKPSIWQTNVAKLIYILTIIFLSYAIYYFTKHRIKEKHKYEFEVLKREKINELNQEKIRFFTNISHEIRTPLTLIISPLEQLLKNKDINKEIYNKLEIINRNAKRIFRLINQLLDLRKIESGKMNLKVEYNDIIKFIREIVILFEEYAREKNINLYFDSDNHTYYTWFDVDKLDKIIFNILSNAFKYTNSKGTIEVTIKRKILKDKENNEKPFVEIAISDTGSGISKEHLEKIFDKFYQVTNSTYKNYGTGLGLAITKNLIEIHKGIINVESIPNQGTTFKIYLPDDENVYTEEEKIKNTSSNSKIKFYRHKTEIDIESNSKIDINNERKNKETIIIVEDDLDLRNYLTIELNNYYNVITNYLGNEAYEKILEILPELVLIDLMIPEINGIDLCKLIKTNILSSHIPVIIITARAEQENYIESIKSGADLYITKPFDIDILKLHIKQLIDNRKKLKEKFSAYLYNSSETGKMPSIEDKFIEKVTSIIINRISESDLSVESLSKEIGVSRGHLHRKLKTLTGFGPNEYIRMIRLKEATKLLKTDKYNISEIAYMEGFNNPAYFTKCFKDFYKISPSEFLENLDKKNIL